MKQIYATEGAPIGNKNAAGPHKRGGVERISVSVNKTRHSNPAFNTSYGRAGGKTYGGNKTNTSPKSVSIRRGDKDKTYNNPTGASVKRLMRIVNKSVKGGTAVKANSKDVATPNTSVWWRKLGK